MDLTSNSRKNAARNVLIVREKRLSADQMKRTGTTITPNIIRTRVITFSLRADISSLAHIELTAGSEQLAGGRGHGKR
jgi:hypothetical protein